MDKREAVRVPVRVRARCRCEDTVVDGLVEDMSRSGLFLRAPGWIGVGSAAEVVLDLPGAETLRLNAQVVRIDGEGIGLRFVDQDRTRRSLANFIMRQHATSR